MAGVAFSYFGWAKQAIATVKRTGNGRKSRAGRSRGVSPLWRIPILFPFPDITDKIGRPFILIGRS